MNYKKLIIDVDTGADDALAILYLIKKIPEKILGITVCAGNTTLENSVKNTLKTLEIAGTNIPVYVGERKNSLGDSFIHAEDYHGKNGLMNIPNKTSLKPQVSSAVDFILENARKYKKDLAVVCLAPPTNIAKAIQKNRVAMSKVGTIVIMGGALKVDGNQTEFAEFNFYQDTNAVSQILKNQKNIFIVPLDVTNKCTISEKEIAQIKTTDSPISIFSKQIILNWYEIFGRKNKREFEFYDPLAATALTDNFLEFEKLGLDIVTRGTKVGSLTGGKNMINLAKKVNANKFKSEIKKTLF